MSKKTKAASKDARLKKKRAIRNANRAKYDAWRNSGQNTKSKRVRIKSKKTKKLNLSTTHNKCGNIGCTTCRPNQFVPRGPIMRGQELNQFLNRI